MLRTRAGTLLAGCLALVALGGGCSPTTRPELKSLPAVSASVPVPADGITLAQIGFRNGPATAFSVPRTVVLATSVDEPTGVTLVFSNPTPAQLAGYLRRTLPSAGFTVSHDDRATSTLTFTGYGWHGSFTGTAGTSAVILRP